MSFDLSMISEAFPGGVYYKDIQGVYLGCNQSMAVLLGLDSVEAIVGKTDVDLCWHDQFGMSSVLNHKDRKKNTKTSMEVHKVNKNGDIKTYLFSENALKDSEGEIAGFLGVLTDITKQKNKGLEAEKKLRISNIYLKNILDRLPEPIYWLDANGVVLGCNEAEAKIFGFETANEVVGKSIYDLGEILSWSKEMIENLQENNKKVMHEKTARSVEETVLSPEGKLSIFLSHKAPLYDEHNNVIGVIGTSIDLSERKKRELDIEERLRMSDIYLKNIVNNLPEPIYWTDRNSVVLGCNEAEAKLFGFKKAEDVVGKNVYDLIEMLGWDKEIAEKALKNDEEIMANKMSKNVEEEARSLDGKIRTFFSHKACLYDEIGNVIGVIGTSIDITQRKVMEEDLKKAKERAEIASRAKTEFIANMSHDVKTPLSGIISLSQLLNSRVQAEYRDLTQDVLDASQQLMIFFENCIEVSKLEGGSIALSEENFSLKHLLNEIFHLFQPSVKSKGLELHLDYREEIPECLFGNRATLYRTLLNLVGNAVKFTPQGAITIRAQLSQRSTDKKAVVKLIITDTGIGIPKDKQQAIFERFSRAVPSHQSAYEGYGIGLYIVQKFVKAMDGDIRVKSQEGKGSQFTVVVPFQVPLLADDGYEDDVALCPNLSADSLAQFKFLIDADVVKNSLAEKTEFSPETNFNQAKILLVEDSLIAQKGAILLLQSLGCDVTLAECGEKAVSLFKPGHYALVFMDIGLPDLKGYEVAKRFREMEKGTSFSVPILGLSAHATEDEQQFSIAAGMQEMLSKPLLEDSAKRALMKYVPIQLEDTKSGNF